MLEILRRDLTRSAGAVPEDGDDTGAADAGRDLVSQCFDARRERRLQVFGGDSAEAETSRRGVMVETQNDGQSDERRAPL
jgi:hypothetical protein